jgi:glycosyltransferase involved in cell wall biosynthesis
MTNYSNKFAILSHILPPSSSGQAIMLYRLLKERSKNDYILISRQNYNNSDIDNTGSETLPAKYYFLCSDAKPMRVYSYPVIQHILNIALSVIPRVKARANCIADILRKERPYCLLACTADLLDMPAGYIACKKAGIPFVPYIFDDYVYQWTGSSRLFARVVAWFVMPRSFRIIGPNTYIAKEFKRRYGKDMDIIHNPCDMPKLPIDVIKNSIKLDSREINIVYTGAVYRANNDSFINLLKAIDLIDNKNIKLHIFTGQSKDELQKMGISHNCLEVYGHVNQSEIAWVLQQATILFLPLAFKSPVQEVITTSAPSKMGEYMSMAKPIFVNAPSNSFISWYFKHHKAAMVVDENNPQIIANKLRELISNPGLQKKLGQKARSIAESDFDLKIIRNKFDQLLNSYQAIITKH